MDQPHNLPYTPAFNHLEQRPAEELPGQFTPINGKARFDGLGGLVSGSWYVSHSGSVRMALRVAEDVELIAEGRGDGKSEPTNGGLTQPIKLRKGGVLMLDPPSGVVMALQPESFCLRYCRSFSSGEKIVALDCPLKDQAAALRLSNSSLQERLREIIAASGPKNWLKWRKLKAQRLELDGFGAEIAAHVHDLRVLAL